jgi:phosphocarrier protein FPr
LQLAPVAIPDDAAGEGEEERLERALEEVRLEIARTRDEVASRAGEAEAAIFDAHRLLLDDPELVGGARRAIAEEGRNAAAAFAGAADRAAAAWRGLDDDYLRARAADVDAVGEQVVRALLGVESAPGLGGEGIVVAPDLTPAQTAALDATLVTGIATATGAPTSHSAILARSLGIPAVVALGEEVLELPEGTVAVLDGDAGTLLPDPAPGRLEEARAAAGRRQARAAVARAHAAEPAATTDGVTIDVAANVGSPEDARAAAAAGADGIGLLRSEFVFLGRTSLPDEEEQVAAYREIARALGGRPVVLRTLDVGADKPLPFLRQPSEANPFLGRRGLRLGLALPDVLRTQLRAALRVAAELPLAVMFPMVSTVDELRQARRILAAAEEELRERGEPLPERLTVGMMVEVPAAALTAAAFAREVDFFSLGTNDLTQYVLAAERGNEHVAGLADGLHPAVLRLIADVAAAGRAHGAAVHVCGELAADPVAVPLLVGLGVGELSVAPPLVPAVKERVRETSAEAAGGLATRALELAEAAEVRALVRSQLPVAAQV